MTPAEILPSLVELSIAIAGFSGIAVAVQDSSDRSPQQFVYLTALLASTFVSSVLAVAAMILLASPLSASTAWSATSLVHAVAMAAILVVRSVEQRRGAYVLTRPLLIATFALLFLIAIQLLNLVAIREPWVCISGLAIYSFFGFGFFVSLLLELVRPDAA